ncbi:MAG TPA: hypothetical protein DCG34_05790 [Clostridiales bacterium]|nr:hypothetical protein [Clostridiales bacterium]
MKQCFKKLPDCVKPISLMKLILIALTFSCLLGTQGYASDPGTNLQGYGLKIFRIEYGLYPFVQAYIRTYDQEMNPLVNLNGMNVGLMVKGQVYNPEKKQYILQSIRNRQEAIRTILVIDSSKTMAGAPFDASLRAAARFIDGKRYQDQVAILGMDDSKEGYVLISNFERDPGALGRRLADLHANGQKTRLYDGIAAAMQLSLSVDAGGNNTSDAAYVATTSIIVFSDGKDEGSAISRDDLMNRITNMTIPVPVYSLAYTKIDSKFLKNLQAISLNSFGKYYHIQEAYDKMTRSVEDIQNVLQSDYVLTFRAYLPVDGESHGVKVGIEYPSGSGKVRYESSTFEAVAPPNFQAILEAQKNLDAALPNLTDANPYMANTFSPQTNSSTPFVPPSGANTSVKAPNGQPAK